MKCAPALLSCLLLAAGAASARADRLELKDGRVVEGVVTKEGDLYRVASRFGEAEVPARDVKAWDRSSTVEAEWRAKADALRPDDYAGRAELAKWLVSKGRAEEGRGLAEAVVREDPENAVAHEILGHVRHRGAWMTPDEAKIADGLVRRGDRWFTPEEWAVLDAQARARAEAEEARAEGRRVSERVNAAARMMLAPDAALRAEGKRRLEAIAKETANPAFADLVPRLAAYASAADRLLAAQADSGTSANVLMECRLQLAKLKRPIKEFQTSLASNLSGAPVTLQLPEVEVIRIGTTVSIPAGVR